MIHVPSLEGRESSSALEQAAARRVQCPTCGQFLDPPTGRTQFLQPSPEPWYYGCLVRYARVTEGIGVFTSVFGFGVSVVVIVSYLDSDRVLAGLLLVLALLVFSSGYVACRAWNALVLVVVDAARTLRTLRQCHGLAPRHPSSP